MIGDATMVVYVDDKNLHHLPGPEHHTACMLNIDLLTREDHPVSHAAMWCSQCWGRISMLTAYGPEE